MENQKSSTSICSGHGDDMIEEILKRLPAKTVGRFLSVSKPWKALISSPFFIKLQSTTRAPDHHQPYLVHHTALWPDLNRPYLSFNRIPENPENQTSKFSLALPHPQRHHRHDLLSLHFPFRFRFNCIGVARGVVCIIVRPSNHVFLWNPTICKYVTLPPFPPSRPRYLAMPRMMGFGYDEANKIFKVVQLSLGSSTYHVYSYVNNPRAKWRARKNESLGLWRGTGMLDGLELMDNAAGFGFYLISNGTINWILGSEVMAFDCESEELRTIKLPVRESNPAFKLMEYGGKLSLMIAHGNGRVHVWAMEVYGNGDTWCLMISTTKHLLEPYGAFLKDRLDYELLGVYLYQEAMFLMDDDEAKSYAIGETVTAV